MPTIRSIRTAFVVVLGSVISACHPEGAINQDDRPVKTATSPGLTDEQRALLGPGDRRLADLAAEIPNLASISWDDATKEVVLGIRSESMPEMAEARSAVINHIGAHIHGVRIERRSDGYIIDELLAGRTALRAIASEPGVAWWDLDESVPTLRVGYHAGADGAHLESLLSEVGVSSQMVTWLEVEPGNDQASVQDHNRNQVESGFQITYMSTSTIEKTCTHGASVLVDGTYGFLTNAHCTKGDAVGSMDTTEIWQHEKDSPWYDHLVGWEVLDPPTFTGGACPATKQCRYSDAAFIAYWTSSLYAGKKIAETSPVGTTGSGGMNVARYRLAPVSANVVTNMVVRKTGRSTGTTEGAVTATCQDEPSSVSGIVFLCQDKVGLHSQDGDSGSPVYWTEDFTDLNAEVYHMGLLWKGSGSSMTFSPWEGITTDLGVFY